MSASLWKSNINYKLPQISIAAAFFRIFAYFDRILQIVREVAVDEKKGLWYN